MSATTLFGLIGGIALAVAGVMALLGGNMDQGLAWIAAGLAMAGLGKKAATE